MGGMCVPGREKYVVDLDQIRSRARKVLTRVALARWPTLPGVGYHLPKKWRKDIAPVASRCAQPLRGRERPVVCEYTRRTDSDAEVSCERARRGPSERVHGVGCCGQGPGAPVRPKPLETAFAGGRKLQTK